MNVGAKCLKQDQYDIYVKNTFLVFDVDSETDSDVFGGQRSHRRRSGSCPGRLFMPMVKSSHDSAEKNLVETTASTMASWDRSDGDGDFGDFGSATEEASEAQDAQSPSTNAPPSQPAVASKEQMELHKRINRQLSAGSTPTGILFVVERHLAVMNGINLSTAFHRLSRRTTSRDLQGRQVKVLMSMVELAERKARHELQMCDGTLPANCCTIIAWSCAMLKVFPGPLFSALIGVVASPSTSCEVYEVCNLLWACVQYQKAALRHQEHAAGSSCCPLVETSDAITFLVKAYFAQKQLDDIKTSVLLSAFTSIAALLPNSNEKRVLMKDLRHALRRRLSELNELQRQMVFGPKWTSNASYAQRNDRGASLVLCPRMSS